LKLVRKFCRSKSSEDEHILLSHHQNAGQIRCIERVNRSFENVAQFKYLEKTVNSQI
jgi:hypothetical protein